ncbi:disease resistance protein Pik-2-like [Phragmites australis]|uniref:disease resistance protein Pik-2-like n=1 Tax=Phragmites australis TaxID=29695 RepID=UPI002D79D93E|nr:disease resistance protein Pik-2-like [Phragmites australis]
MENAAQSLVGNVGQLLGEEYRLLSGVGGEVAELRDDLATMNALLRMQSEADEGAVDHFVREWMKQLRELAYDAEDSIDHYKLRIKCLPGDGVRARLKHLFDTLFQRHGLAGKIRDLRTRAITISERHARYGINREALRRAPSLSAPPVRAVPASVPALRSANHPEHHQFVGIGTQADTMAEGVKASVEKERYLKVFSVVGFGGVGKTTLAVEVCRRLEAEFPYQAFVSVSQAFEPSRDLKALLKRGLQQVVKPKTDNEKGVKEEGALERMDDLDDKTLAEKLKHCLKGKRYLIVIDDIWTIRAWEAIQSVLPENYCDSRIIVTTRIDTVAKACSPASVSGHNIHHMKPLKLEDATKLFLSRAFGSVDASCPVELKDVMESILRKCGGLPLAIVSIASILAAYTSSGSKDKWETICKSIGSQMESNPTLEGMKQIVTLSYNHLPHELKGCMMYLSIFPEDYEINTTRILCRWIAEGLVSEKRGLTLLEVAESYLDELVSRNMIQPHFGYNGKVESCRVHDMLLEVMVSKSLESNFVSLLGGQYAGMSYDRIRRLSIQGDDRRPFGVEKRLTDPPSKKKMVGRASRHGIQGMDVEHVRSLSMFQLKEHKLLDHLDKFTLLRVLDLEDCEGLTNDHLKNVCRLYLLKFLSLKGTNISKVPPQVEKLEHLQTLGVGNTNLEELPETVTNLEKLEHLDFYHKTKWSAMWKLPRGLRKMKALRVVTLSLLGDDVQVAQELGDLEQLQELCVYIDSPITDEEVLEQLAISLSKTYSLRRLNIGDMGNGKTLNFLQRLPVPPRLLRYFRTAGAMDRLPSWVESLTYLVEFDMSWADLVDDQLFGVLCKLPNLKSIWLQRRSYSDNALVARTSHNFPALMNLKVTSDAECPKVFQFEEGSMSKLETLLINFADKEEKSIVGIEHLTSLKEVLLTGNRYNRALDRALVELMAETKRRPESNQFQVVVKYE